MNPNPARRAALSVGVAVLVVAGCSVTDRKVSGTASAPANAVTPTTSTSAVARLADPATLQSLLGSPTEVAGIVGVDMTPGPISKKPFSNLSTEPARCLEAVMPGQGSSEFYMRTGFASQSLDGAAPHVKVLQVVASFASAADAESSYTIASTSWPSCQDAEVTLTAGREVAVQKLGRIETTDSIMSIPVTQADGNSTASCQHSFTAKRNVIIDVRVCAPNVGNAGRELVSKIAANLT
jgi:hypothetical protein